MELRVLGNRALLRDVPIAADGKVALPPLPNVTCEVRFFCADRLVHFAGYSLRDDTQLPAPQVIDAVVSDDQGKRLPGVAIGRLAIAWSDAMGPFYEDRRGERCEVAVTDGEGKARLLVAHEKSPFLGVNYPAMVFVASREGHVDGISVLAEVRSENGAMAPVAADEVPTATLRFTMPAAEGQRGKLLAAAGKLPAAARWVGTLTYPHAENSLTSVEEVSVVPVGADGSFAIVGQAPGRQSGALQLRVPVPELAADDPFRRTPGVDRLVLPPSLSSGEVDLRTIVPLRLQVVDATGGPAIGANVLCCPRYGGAYLVPQYGVSAVTDTAGRLVLPAMLGESFVLVVHDGTMATSAIDVTKDLSPVVLTLRPMPAMSVRVVDAAGAPVAGAAFQMTGSSWSGGIDAEGDLMAALAHQLSSWQTKGVRTDVAGRATLCFVGGKQVRMRFMAKAGDAASNETSFVENNEPVDIVVHVPR
jgi:hypothetical protein